MDAGSAMDLEERIEKSLRGLGVDPTRLKAHPGFQDLHRRTDAVDRLGRVMALAAKLLENLGRAAPLPRTLRQEYYRQCLARGIRQCDSVHALVQRGDLPDAAIIVRTMAERGIWLAHLAKTDDFQRFADWSFLKSIQHKRMYLEHFGGKGLITKEEREKFDRLNADPAIAKWDRSFKLEDVAKDHGMKQFYDAAYTYNSGHVHPRFGEGYFDLDAIADEFEDKDEHGTLIVNQAASSLLLICVTVAAQTTKKVDRILLHAVGVLTRWRPGQKPSEAKEILDLFEAYPSEKLILYD